MTTIRRALREVMDRRSPALARGLRALRNEWNAGRQKPQQTPFGFLLEGNGSMQSGGYEPNETALLRNSLQHADVFIDIGANVGFYSCLARSLGTHTLAVEPLADNLRHLYRNLLANGWNDVEVWPVGLADRPGLLTLYGAATGASLVPGWAGASPAFGRTIPGTTLDLLLAGRFAGARLVIKIDVEGAEYALLRGALATLARSPRPLWLVEIVRDLHHPGGNRDFARTFELFRSHGYLAYHADAVCTPVTEADVAAWTDGRAAPASYSWVFADDEFPPGR